MLTSGLLMTTLMTTLMHMCTRAKKKLQYFKSIMLKDYIIQEKATVRLLDSGTINRDTIIEMNVMQL